MRPVWGAGEEVFDRSRRASRQTNDAVWGDEMEKRRIKLDSAMLTSYRARIKIACFLRTLGIVRLDSPPKTTGDCAVRARTEQEAGRRRDLKRPGPFADPFVYHKTTQLQ